MDAPDDRATALLLDLPWPPGRSPFRIEGVAYRGHLEYCERSFPGGHAAVLAALGRADVSEFFEQPFLASLRYVFPLAMAGIGCGRVTGTRFPDFARERSRWQANEDVHGVYRWLLRLTSPEMIVGRLTRLIAHYFDFGDVQDEMLERGRFRMVHRGLPRPIVEWYAAVSEPYVEALLGLAGGKDVVCTSQPYVVEGRAHGVEIVSLPMEARWAP